VILLLKNKKVLLDGLLGDDDKQAESTVTVLDEVDMYFEERPKKIHLFGGEVTIVDFLAYRTWQRGFWQYQ